MNYITRLEKENREKQEEIERMREEGHWLRRHLFLDKFKVDTTIQVGDIHNFLDRMLIPF